MGLKAMVMAAGVGSRLDPLTQFVPKPLVPVANRPVMDILFEKLANIGVLGVIANTHYLAEQIINRYKKNPFGIDFDYVKEETLSGTAGGVKKCQYFFDKGQDFLVLSADGLSNADLELAIASHKKSGAIASIGIKKVKQEEIPNFGVIVTDKNGCVLEFQEKPPIKQAKSNCINTGIYVFNYKIFDYIPENTFFDFAKNVFPLLLENGIKINTFPVSEYWSDIGTIAQYRESNFDLFNNLYEIDHSPIIKTNNGQYLSDTLNLPANLKLEGCNIIGKNCNIGENVTLKNCILWDNIEIMPGLKLENCIIASNNKISTSLSNEVMGSQKAAVYNS
jgi:NDP-sugar pyrophosphorylase family protein